MWVKVCVATGAMPFVADTVNAKGAPVLFGGVPESTPVVVFSFAHGGKALADTLKVGAGFPVAVNENEFTAPM